MNSGKCVYCEKDGPLTKEEVFPKFLALKAGFNIVVNRKWGLKPLRLPPVLRDVCRNCNNVVLGQLDSYVSTLFKDYFLTSIPSLVNIQFQYDFQLLHRWLFKVAYNSARAVNERTDGFHVHIPYIRGDRPTNHNSALFVGVFEASEAQPREVAGGMPDVYTPSFHNIGQLKFSNARWVSCFFSLAYTMSFASYCFQIIDFCEESPTRIRSKRSRFLVEEGHVPHM
jgi:hypothetical protein